MTYTSQYTFFWSTDIVSTEYKKKWHILYLFLTKKFKQAPVWILAHLSNIVTCSYYIVLKKCKFS